MPSLKARFDMGPKDFGAFMGVVGFVYACSQFVVAKPVIAWSAARGEWASLRVLLLCLIGMGVGRLMGLVGAGGLPTGVLRCIFRPAPGSQQGLVAISCRSISHNAPI